MSNKYSRSSEDRLNTCHPLLRQLFRAVLEKADHTIVCGHRGEDEQNKAYAQGNSQLQYPDSKHNIFPSMAVDAAPYDSNIKGIPWNDEAAFVEFGELVIETAQELGIRIRWGGDWDGDGDRSDQSFNDLPHFELILGGAL